jgi:hypothetical protein
MAFVYNNGAKLLSGSYWTGTTLKGVFVDASYIPNRDDVFVSVLGNSECSGSGSSRGFSFQGRKTLAGKSITVDNTANAVNYLCNDYTASSVSIQPNAIVIVEEKTSDADSLLIAYIDSATTATPMGNDLPVLFENGIAFTKTT